MNVYEDDKDWTNNLQSDICCTVEQETYRPSHLPPKNKAEFAAHSVEVKRLERLYREKLQKESARRTLEQMGKDRREYRISVLSELWLMRLLPELSQKLLSGVHLGEEIETTWRQGLPPAIRRVVWPMAIGNSLRITPELFEISAQKAVEVRTFESLSEASSAMVSNYLQETENRKKIIKPTFSNSTKTASSSAAPVIPSSDTFLHQINKCVTTAAISRAQTKKHDVVEYHRREIESQNLMNSGKDIKSALNGNKNLPVSSHLSNETIITHEEKSFLCNQQEDIMALHSKNSTAMLQMKKTLIDLFMNRKKNCNNREGSIRCIRPDVPRTFPSLRIFQDQPIEGPLHQSCQKLLEGWVCYRPDVGYVQGMSFIAALLLVYMDTFPAFVSFCNLMSLPSLLGLYTMNPTLLSKHYQIFDDIFKAEYPELFNHLEYLNIPKEMYLLEWLLTLYAKPLSLDIASYIWDLFFLEGDIILYTSGVAIMKLIGPFVLNPWKKRHPPQTTFVLKILTQQINETNVEEEEYHDAFDHVRYILSNVRRLITDEGKLLSVIREVNLRIPPRIIRTIRMMGSYEFPEIVHHSNSNTYPK